MKTTNLMCIISAAASVAFAAPEMPKTGVVMELWENVKTGRVAELVATGEKRQPNAIYIRPNIDEGESGKDNFGTRFSALLSVPADGEYTFYLAADDAAELWLSTDDSSANLKKICATASYTPRRHFVPGKAAGKVKLKKGKKYSLVLYHKEAVSADHVALAWEGPGIKKQVVARKYFTPVLTPAQKKLWEQTYAQEAAQKKLLATMLKQNPAELPAWLAKLNKKDSQLLDQALQQIQAELQGKNSKQQQKMLRPYVKMASGIVASPDSPVSHPVAKRLLQLEEAYLKSLSLKQLQKMGPHRLAASLGKIPASAKAVTVTRKLNSCGDKWRDEHLSLGLYAPPGKLVTVTLPDSLVGKNLEIQVGHHFPEKNKPLVCMPGTTRRVKLDKATTCFVTPHGGLMLLKVPREIELSDTPVTISGALEAPRFVLGQDSDADWEKLKKAPGPWGELVCEHLVLIVARDTLQNLTNPTALMTWWNENNRDMEDFYAYYPKVPFRMHSGYYAEEGLSYWPLQWGTKSVENILNLESMQARNAALYLHEHGHHCDFGEMELSFWAEATPNWGGYYLKAREGKAFTWKATHDKHLRELFDPNNKGMREIMQDKWYKINTKGTHHWSYAVTSMMIGYTEDFGWECMKTTIKRLRDKTDSMYGWPFVKGADPDQAKIDRYLIGLSEAAQRDVRPYFAHFKLFPSAGAARYLDALKLRPWDLTYLVQPEQKTTAADTPLSIPCGQAQLLSFAKDSAIHWEPATAKGGKVTPNGKGSAIYTPPTGFTGVDVLTYRLSNQYGDTVTKKMQITVE